jgi:hypothetical protein
MCRPYIDTNKLEKKGEGVRATSACDTSQREILVFIGSRPIYYIRPLQESNITLIYHIGLLRN